MRQKWMAISVEFLGGMGDELWPYPGRVFAVSSTHTFAQLANSIDAAFSRWDLSHLAMFTLPDGRIITDAQTGQELANAVAGPLLSPLDISKVKIGDVLAPEDEFRYEFDFGAGWVHRCNIEDEPIDPLEVLGSVPSQPRAFWGWGEIPDQYGRRTEDDDGQTKLPRRPRTRHLMFGTSWPGDKVLPKLDLDEVMTAVAIEDGPRFLAAVVGREVDEALQQVGLGMPIALDQCRAESEAMALSIINRLNLRRYPGDEELAGELLARIRNQPLPGRAVPVALGQLCDALAKDESGAYLNLETGSFVAASEADDQIRCAAEGASPQTWLHIDASGADTTHATAGSSNAEASHEPSAREHCFGRIRELLAARKIRIE